MVAVALGFVIYPLIEGGNDVINSDWPAFATGGRLIVEDPGHLYDFDTQRRVQLQVTGGRTLVTLGIKGILPFLAPAWVAFIAVPFDLLGTNLGGRLWILFELACLALGLYLAVRPRPPTADPSGAVAPPPREAGRNRPGFWRVPSGAFAPPPRMAGRIRPGFRPVPSGAFAPPPRMAGRIRPGFRPGLPAFASVPTALLLLNAQLDGIVALGIGAAFALWSRPYLAGLALGLTLMKPQLVLPIGFALLVARRWRVVVGWAAAGLLLLGSTAALNPHWISEWLAVAGTTVQPGSREVDLAHFGVLFPAGWQQVAEATVSLIAIVAVILLAWRRREDFRSAAAVLVAGGVLASPHALPTDLVVVAVALVIWGEAEWSDWVLLSVGAAIAAIVPAPWPTPIGVLLVGWLCLRAGGLSGWRPGRAPASAG
jgi:Glycosyltransferase family 87